MGKRADKSREGGWWPQEVSGGTSSQPGSPAVLCHPLGQELAEGRTLRAFIHQCRALCSTLSTASYAGEAEATAETAQYELMVTAGEGLITQGIMQGGHCKGAQRWQQAPGCPPEVLQRLLGGKRVWKELQGRWVLIQRAD